MSKNKYILILLISLIKAESATANALLYCKTVDKSRWVMDQETRIEKRKGLAPLIKGSLGSIVAFLNEYKIVSLIMGVIIHVIIVGSIFIGSFVSLIFFCIFCCRLQKSPAQSRVRAKNFWCGAFFVGLFFVFVFIVFIVFFKEISNGTDEINCVLSNSAVEVLDGVNNSDYEFLGFNTLITLLERFSDEGQNFKVMSEYFDNIFNENLVEKGKAPLDSVNEFFNTYKDNKLKDGLGKDETPIVISELSKDNDKIKIEFEKWNNIAIIIALGSEHAKKISTQDAIGAFSETIKKVITATREFKNEIEGPLNNLSIGVAFFLQWFNSVYIASIIFGAVNIFLFLFTVVVLFFQCRKLRCYKCNCFLKTILIVMGLSNFIFSTVSLYVMVVAGGVGSVCNDFPLILNSDDPANYIASTGVTMNEKLNSLVNKCIIDSNTGNFTSLMKEVDDFSKYELILDGVTTFRNFEIKLSRAPLDSEIITNTTKIWENYNSGYWVNFENIKTTLKSFNDQIVCDLQEIVFSKLNCTVGSPNKCVLITDVSIPYNPPECVNDSEKAINNFTILKDYDTANKLKMGKMLIELGGPETNTANTKYKELKEALERAIKQQKKIEPELFQTLNKASKVKTGFTQAATCKILRKELENVEAALCFGNANSYLYGYIFGVLMNFLLLLFNWGVFCTIRNVVEERPFDKLNDSVDLGDGMSMSEG